MTVSCFDNIIFALLAGDGEVSLLDVPTHFRNLIEKDIKELTKALNQPNIEYGSFIYMNKPLMIFVYIHPSNTQLKCSSVGIQEWDKIGIVSMVPTDIHLPPTPMLDLEPFFKDNVSLASSRRDDARLQAICSGQVQADDSGKYSWYGSHSLLDWNDDTWVT